MLGMFLEMNAKEMMNAGRVMTKVKCSAAKSSNIKKRSESRAQVKRREGKVTSVTSSRCTLVSITAIIDPSLQFLF